MEHWLAVSSLVDSGFKKILESSLLPEAVAHSHGTDVNIDSWNTGLESWEA